MSNENESESWLPVVGFEGLYEVSSLGRIRRLSGKTAGHIVAADTKPGKAYLRVRIVKNHAGHWKNVHRLVCEAFHGPCPEGMETRHKDSDSFNNRADNLAWGTRAENTADRVDARSNAGERNGRSVLTAELARRIRGAVGSYKTIAVVFGVGVSTVCDIKKGRTWADALDSLSRILFVSHKTCCA